LLAQKAALQHNERPIGQGVDRGFNTAFELVMTPALFGFLGHLLDNRLGTGRLIMLTSAIFVAGYVVWKFVHNYNNEMDSLQRDLVNSRLAGTEQFEIE
jgi:hypothetical protein